MGWNLGSERQSPLLRNLQSDGAYFTYKLHTHKSKQLPSLAFRDHCFWWERDSIRDDKKSLSRWKTCQQWLRWLFCATWSLSGSLSWQICIVAQPWAITHAFVILKVTMWDFYSSLLVENQSLIGFDQPQVTSSVLPDFLDLSWGPGSQCLQLTDDWWVVIKSRAEPFPQSVLYFSTLIGFIHQSSVTLAKRN